MASFSPRIDLRGMRADEAIQTLQSLVDDAILLNVTELYVLHGKGDGILRQRVREYLAGVEEVKRYADEHVDRGGHGITIISFR
jgi:DNA mismatch repair protein MutS2